MNEVDAVNQAEIVVIKTLLTKHFGQVYADIWTFGLNTALRISDLLSLQMKDVSGVEELVLTEQKTGKKRTVRLNQRAQDVIARRLIDHPHDVWLFQAQGRRVQSLVKPLDRSTVARKFAEIGDLLQVRLGTHSMRKTRGAAMFADHVPLEVICKVLNHSSPAVTMRYIGIDKETVAKTYDDYVL